MSRVYYYKTNGIGHQFLSSVKQIFRVKNGRAKFFMIRASLGGTN